MEIHNCNCVQGNCGMLTGGTKGRREWKEGDGVEKEIIM